MYVSIHAEKKWNVGVTAEQKDEAIHKIFTAGQGSCKSPNRKVDLRLLNCQAVRAHAIYNLKNVGKTFAQIKQERDAKLPIPDRKKECAAAREKFDTECNKIPEDGKPESEWEWNTPQAAIACLQDTTSDNFKQVEKLCSAKHVYPQVKNEEANTDAQKKKTVRDEL
eukprot:UN03065